MNYLGIEIEKPRIGVFDFTGCEGCELQLANKEGTLLDFLALVEIVNFREISSHRENEYDIALIEGAISREDEVARLKKIREQAKILVAIGACACYGGVNALKNHFDLEEVVREVYPQHKVETSCVRRIGDVVTVDLEVPGCPISKEEIEKIVVSLVTHGAVKLPEYPVCVECKQKLNTCVIELGRICLGPITKAGCDAVCPSGKVGCLGCRGPAKDANIDSLKNILREHGFSDFSITEKMSFYNAFSGA